ncbi:MAG: hypothetical protein RL756_684 [Pseudomonadota bacterium]|jgi:nitrate reductase NapE component
MNNKFLSVDRRGGSQVSADLRDGRTARHAQGWRELNAANDPMDVPTSIIHALVLAFSVWLTIALAVVGAVALLG